MEYFLSPWDLSNEFCGVESCRLCLERGGKSQKVKYSVYDIQVEQEVFLKCEDDVRRDIS